ncbi:unnamed protein product [Calypogeia fissa]
MENAKRTAEQQVNTAREHLPNRQQTLGLLAWVAVGMAVLTVGGVTVTGGAVFLAVAIPVVIFFSPILVPIGGFLLLSTVGILVAVGIGLAALSAVIWLYRYLKGEEPVYYDRVDAARNRITGTAMEVKEWAREHVPQVHAARSA